MNTPDNTPKIATVALHGDYISAQGTVLKEWDVKGKDTVTRWAEVDLGNRVVSGPLITQTDH